MTTGEEMVYFAKHILSIRQHPPTQPGACLAGNMRLSLAGIAIKIELDVTLKVSKCSHETVRRTQKASVATTTATFHAPP
jgi:hypothetical protein